MVATPTQSPRFFARYPDTDLPLVGGKVYTYAAGTNDEADTWADADKNSELPNPIILEADGGIDVYIDGAYKFAVHDPFGSLLYEVDDILGGSGIFDRPASGVTSLPFDDIIAENVQDALEELGAKRIKLNDTQALITLLRAVGAIKNPGDIYPAARVTAAAGELRCNGAAVSRTTYPDLFAALVTAAGYSAQTFTVTIASPAVFTKNAHGFKGGERVRFTTTGALPTGLATATDYFVSPSPAANTFNVRASPSGANINTSGSQSGVHSLHQSWFGLGDGTITTGTTFNVPTDADLFMRGLGATFTLGSRHPETIGPHSHVFVGNALGTHQHETPDTTHYGALGNANRGWCSGDQSSTDYSAPSTGVSAGTPTGTIQNNTGAENVPAHMRLPWYIKT